MGLESALKVVTGVVIFVVALAAAIPYGLHRQFTAAMEELARISTSERQYADLLSMLRGAETGQRGFIITGDEAYLQPYYAAVAALPAQREKLRAGAAAEEAKVLQRIEQSIDLKLADLAETIASRRQGGFGAAASMVIAGQGKRQMDLLRTLINEQISAKNVARAVLHAKMLNDTRSAAFVSIAAGVVNVVALLSVLIVSHFNLRRRRHSDRVAKAASLQLEARSQESQRRNEQLAGNVQLMHALGMAESLDECSEIISAYLSWLLPDSSGCLYLYRNSRDMLVRQVTWGDDSGEPERLHVEDCWALRKGRPHIATQELPLFCAHVPKDSAGRARICLPLVAQGDVLGSLTIIGAENGPTSPIAEAQWIEQLAEQIALALSNVQLRLSLRRQSVVDPLTELYNRRFMDEALQREMARAERHGKPVAVVLADLDHFKRVNDNFGHDAGDALLRAVAQLVRDNIRKCDIACRFGGEEMVLILPECDAAVAALRANALRERIEQLNLPFKGGTIHATASFGVAASAGIPAQSGEQLLAAADEALYAAKRAGRNQVRVAPSTAQPEALQASP
jgi:diguanylate cyclase (GGDEF)-like protein